jgi:hypothetical protein
MTADSADKSKRTGRFGNKKKESSTLKPTISAPASFCSWPPGNSPDQ